MALPYATQGQSVATRSQARNKVAYIPEPFIIIILYFLRMIYLYSISLVYIAFLISRGYTRSKVWESVYHYAVHHTFDYCCTCFSMGDLGVQVSVRSSVRSSIRQHLPWVSCERNSSYSFVPIFLKLCMCFRHGMHMVWI